MKRFILPLIFLLIISSCSSDEKAIDYVFANTTRGTILRTIEPIASNFIYNNPESKFELLVEQQGEVFDFLRLHVTYIDRDTNGNGIKTQEIIFKDIGSEEFYTGPVELPRILLSFSFLEIAQSLNLDFESISTGDQFELRAEIFLEDGRSFSNSSASPVIINEGGFFRSPFKYIISVISPIQDHLFTGDYFYEVLSDRSPAGTLPTGNASVRNGVEDNQRRIGLPGLSTLFTISGNFLYPKIYGTMQSPCPDAQCTIYSGPDESSFGQFDRQDDTVFIFDVLIGYENWTGDLGQTPPYLFTIRLTKQ